MAADASVVKQPAKAEETLEEIGATIKASSSTRRSTKGRSQKQSPSFVPPAPPDDDPLVGDDIDISYVLR